MCKDIRRRYSSIASEWALGSICPLPPTQSKGREKRGRNKRREKIKRGRKRGARKY